ncbi:MAG: sialidase family protein [Planctomycetota bacterium]
MTAAALLAGLLALGSTADELALVSAGEPRHVESRGEPWKSEDGALVGAGEGNELDSTRALGAGDFLVRAVLSIDEPDGTAASLVLGWNNHFGFDGRGRTYYVNGPWFGGRVQTLGNATGEVVAGEELVLEVERTGGRVTFRAGGREVHALDAAGPVGPVGLSPWRATLRVRELSVRGAVTDLPELPELVDVFTSGEGYPSFRIPALAVARDGALLAFAEGRERASDHAENDLVLRRSADSGRTWGELQVVAEDGANCLNNPCPVVDRESGRILLAYQRFPEGIHEREVVPGYDGDAVCRSLLVHSDDGGRTWSTPRDVTRQVKRPARVTSIASGPGAGVQLREGPHAGRLVLPFNEGPFGAWRVYAAWSDDGGESWSYGEPAPAGSPGHGNEVQVAELPGGRLLLNSRSHGGAKCRKVAVSEDGGATWSPLVDEPKLPEPQCQASLLRAGERLLFLNPASRTGRFGGRLRRSDDWGATWTDGLLLYPGSFAYSCLAELEGGRVACLFERDGYARISLALVEPGAL